MVNVINNSRPGDRIQVLDQPVAAPAICVVCKAGGGKLPQGERLKFIDFGMDIEYYGAVYFCSNCIVNVAYALGYYGPAEMAAVESKLARLYIEHAEMKDQNDALRNALHSLGISLGIPSNATVESSEFQDFTGATDVLSESESESIEQGAEFKRPNVPSFEFNKSYDL